eukprot:jgi/Mesvir1/7152/Mv02512-RA.1
MAGSATVADKKRDISGKMKNLKKGRRFLHGGHPEPRWQSATDGILQARARRCHVAGPWYFVFCTLNAHDWLTRNLRNARRQFTWADGDGERRPYDGRPPSCRLAPSKRYVHARMMAPSSTLHILALPTHVGASHGPEEFDGLTSSRKMRSAARPIPSSPAGHATRSIPCSPEPSPSSLRRLSPAVCIGDGSRNSKKNPPFGPDGNSQKRPSCRRPKRQVRTGTAGNATASVSKQQDHNGLRAKGQCKPFVAPYVPSTAEGIIAMDMLRRRESEPHGMVVEEEFFHRRVGEQLQELQEQIDLWQKRLEVLEAAGENCGAYEEEGWEGVLDHPEGPWDIIREQGLNLDWGDEDAVMGSKSTGWDVALSRKVAALQLEHLEKAAEEVLYAIVMQRFCRLDVKLLPPMTRRAKGQRVSRVNMGPSRAQQLRGVLSPGCNALLEQQLALAVGEEAMALLDDAVARGDGGAASSSSDGHKILFRKRELAELYVSSILCGLCLRRVERRLALERSLAGDEEEGDDPGWEEDEEGEGEDVDGVFGQGGELGGRFPYEHGRRDGDGDTTPQPDTTRLYLERLLEMGSAPSWLPQSQAVGRPAPNQPWDDGPSAGTSRLVTDAGSNVTSRDGSNGAADASLSAPPSSAAHPSSPSPPSSTPSSSSSPFASLAGMASALSAGASSAAKDHQQRLEQGNAVGRADVGAEGSASLERTAPLEQERGEAGPAHGDGSSKYPASGQLEPQGVGVEEGYRDPSLMRGDGDGIIDSRGSSGNNGMNGSGSSDSVSLSGAAWRGGLGRGVGDLSSSSIREYMCMLPRELLQDLTHISSTASVNVVGRHVQAVFGLSFVSSGGSRNGSTGAGGSSSGGGSGRGGTSARDGRGPGPTAARASDDGTDAGYDSGAVRGGDEDGATARSARGAERRGPGAASSPEAKGAGSQARGTSTSASPSSPSSVGMRTQGSSGAAAQGGPAGSVPGARATRKESPSTSTRMESPSSPVASSGSRSSGGGGSRDRGNRGDSGDRSSREGGGPSGGGVGEVGDVTEDGASGGLSSSELGDRELEAVVKLPVATLRRVHMEAAAFGVFLCDMEHEVNCLALARTLREH